MMLIAAIAFGASSLATIFIRSIRRRHLTAVPKAAEPNAAAWGRRSFFRRVAIFSLPVSAMLADRWAQTASAANSAANHLRLAARERRRLAAAAVKLPGKPRWASWNVDELNSRRDGWSESGAWLARILNSRGLKRYTESFPNESKQAHHWGMVVDLRKCIGCQACVVACKSENNVPPGVFRTWVQVVEKGTMKPDARGSIVTDEGRFESSVKRSALPRLCNHCDNPPCVIVCPVKATFKRADGPILIDPTKCIGCGICVQSCPYDARYFHTVQETADKCTFCVQRLDQGLLPACVTSCVARARVFGDLNNPNSAVSRIIAEHPTDRLLEHLGTDPQIFYINLDGELTLDASVFDTIYPYAAGTNTNEYDDLTGKVLLETPSGTAS